MTTSSATRTRRGGIIALALSLCVGAGIASPNRATASSGFSTGAEVHAAQPCVGGTVGGTTITVLGLGFWGPDRAAGGGDDASGVSFATSFADSTPSPSITVVSDSEIRVTTPARPTGNVIVAVVFPDSTFQYAANLYRFSDEPGDNGPCGVSPAPTNVPSFQGGGYIGCPGPGGLLRVWGWGLDQLSDSDSSWGVWVVQRGLPAGRPPVEPGTNEVKATVYSRTATEIVFRLPSAEQLPGWSPGDIINVISRNGHGQMGWAGINWWRAGACGVIPPGDPGLESGQWPACTSPDEVGCYVLTDTTGNTIPGVGLWIEANSTDRTSWGVWVRAVPSTKTWPGGGGTWKDGVQFDSIPPDGFDGDHSFDLASVLTSSSTLRITLRMGPLLAPKFSIFRGMIDPAAPPAFTSAAGGNTFSFDLHPALVTYPTAAQRPTCQMVANPNTRIGYDPPACDADQGGSTQLVATAYIERWPFWSGDTDGAWLATTAPLTGGYDFSRDAAGAPILGIPLGAPHRTADGSTNIGAVQTWLPDATLAYWGINANSADDLAAQLHLRRDDDGTPLSAVFSRRGDGYLVEVADLHFSSPVIEARTSAVQVTSTAAPTCSVPRMVVRGSGFRSPDGTDRITAVLFARSDYEQVTADYRVVDDTTLRIEIPPGQAAGAADVSIVGPFGRITVGSYTFPARSSDIPAPAAEPGAGRVTLSWSATSWTDPGVVTDYVVQRSRNCGPWETVADGRSTRTSTVVRGLTNGSSYRFRVAPRRGRVLGTWSEPAIAIPFTNPAAPRHLVVTPGAGQLTATWMAPRSDGGDPVTDYRVEWSTDGRTWTAVPHVRSTETSRTITGLDPAKRYRMRVSAINAAGAGRTITSAYARSQAR